MKTKTRYKVVQVKMILTCPECKTQYLLPSAAIPVDGRKVRCSSCRHVWLQEKTFEVNIPDFTGMPMPEETKEEPIAPLPPLDDPQELSDIVKTESREGILPFLAGMAIVFAVFFAYILFDKEIPVGQGLAFDNVTIERIGNEALEVKGAIFNTMDDKRKVPDIRMTYIGLEGVEGDSRLFRADKDILDAGETIPLSFILEDVPEDTANIRISFEVNAPTETQK